MIAPCTACTPRSPATLELAGDRVRAATMGAENLLHDHGVIPMTSSDALGMGRAGETWRRTFALAAVTKGAGRATPRTTQSARQRPRPALPGQAHDQPGPGARDRPRGGQPRGRPDGRHRPVGAGLLRRQARARAQVRAARLGRDGDPNAAIDRVEPRVLGPQFGGYGATAPSCRCCSSTRPRTRRGAAPCRPADASPGHGLPNVRLSTMAHHGATGEVTVDPHSGETRFRGELLTMAPVDRAPLQQLYHL